MVRVLAFNLKSTIINKELIVGDRYALFIIAPRKTNEKHITHATLFLGENSEYQIRFLLKKNLKAQ